MSVEEFEERTRQIRERMRELSAESERWKTLPLQDRLALLLNNEPILPDPKAFDSRDLGVRLKAWTATVGVRIWEYRVRELREQIAAGATSDESAR